MSGNETSSAAAYKPLPQVPPSQALLAQEEDENDDADIVVTSSKDIRANDAELDVQSRYTYQGQNLAYRSHSPSPVPYKDDVKGSRPANLEALEMASYEAPELTYGGGGSLGVEADLAGTPPVKEERKGDKTALYVTLVSFVYMRSFFVELPSSNPCIAEEV